MMKLDFESLGSILNENESLFLWINANDIALKILNSEDAPGRKHKDFKDYRNLELNFYAFKPIEVELREDD